MPAFQTPFVAGQKRTSEYDDTNLPQQKRIRGNDVGSRNDASGYWMVQWRSPQYKKHKTWDGDAILVVRGNWVELQDAEDGRRMAFTKPTGIEGIDKIVPGATFKVGDKDIEVDRLISEADYMSGKCFSSGVSVGQSDTPSVLRNSSSATKQFVPLRPKPLNGGFKAPSFVAGSSKMGAQSSAKSVSTPVRSGAEKTKAERESVWAVNWRKPQQKKHKTWDGDAYLMQTGDVLTLVSEKGLIMGTKRWDGTPLYVGYKATITGKEIEVDGSIKQSQMPTIAGKSTEYEDELEFGDPPQTQAQTSFLLDQWESPGVDVKREPAQSPAPTSGPSAKKPYVAPSSFYAHKPAKPKVAAPLHNPNDEGAVTMPSGTDAHHAKYNKKNAPVVPVVIDPIVARRLRPHQIEGVKFMYECVMAMKGHDGKGCILADEMGMGKTLQTITLVWTLLKQNPYWGIGPTVGKVLIVCPVTLINNWKNEFHKWLGRDRLGIFVGDKDNNTIKQFMNSRIHHVLVIGYERLRKVIGDLQYCIPPIGLIICDEGHRLKSANNKTSTMFEVLPTPRRIILSGTPIQNDLSEFHAMADFCNPGLLNDYNSFRKLYEAPILKSRAPGCSEKEKELGEARMQQLMETSKSFVLRREATILKNYLPPKYEYVVFITPTQLQRDIFHQFLTTDKLDNLVRNSTAESLALIQMLTKISNSPILLKATADKAREKGREGDLIKKNTVIEALKLMPERAQIEDVSLSGKLVALANLLRAVYKNTDEKFIIVSHFTSTLNIIEAFCKKKGYTYHRLDGSTPTTKRQDYVNEFNKTPQKQRFIFLLSSKAGGVGLNLIGASRLCLIDSDWNPSHDLQSMARIHRDGQKRPVYIYRFLTAGSIDEKIYQRQVTKLGLSNSLLGAGGSESKSDSFTKKDLRDIFTVHPNTACHTHDLLECPCDSPDGMTELRKSDMDEDASQDSDQDDEMGFVTASLMKPEQYEKQDKEYLKQKKAQLAALGKWTHINCLRQNARERIQDELLRLLVYVPETDNRTKDDGPPRSRLNSLLAAVDLENVLQATAPPLPVEDLPGGSVSFLFERTSETRIDDDAEALSLASESELE